MVFRKLTHTLSPSLSHTHTLSLSLTHTHFLFLSHTHYLYISLLLSPSHTHTHTHTHSVTHTQSPPLLLSSEFNFYHLCRCFCDISPFRDCLRQSSCCQVSRPLLSCYILLGPDVTGGFWEWVFCSHVLLSRIFMIYVCGGVVSNLTHP